ncbi:patatin-like phospholipase family protein [Jongsikchunia kroppenstedtii]|uniref:patatin-like phospholipase family protein n=1 Tax=Jongsikchunia kroppenstedtii TaxID=1121721 RepID=UPI00036C406F|nr:patatin-like phospholipase family protein [Jongsikchunia kroppenstedtii]
MPTVAEVLAARRDHLETDNNRIFADGCRLALIIEGGGSRGVFGGGMLQALSDAGLTGAFDAVYGTSAGALCGAWMLSERVNFGMAAWVDQANLNRTVNLAGILRGRPPFDLEYLVHEIYSRIAPMDFDAILNSPIEFHPIATDAITSEPTDLRPLFDDVAGLKQALAATCCLPMVAGSPVALGDSRFLDGGLTESVPIRSAVEQGATHAVVLRTRRLDERSESAPVVRSVVGDAYIRLAVPGAWRAWRDRGKQQALEEAAIAELGDHVLEIRPPLDAPTVPGSSRDSDLMTRAMAIGRQVAQAALEQEVGVGTR